MHTSLTSNSIDLVLFNGVFARRGHGCCKPASLQTLRVLRSSISRLVSQPSMPQCFFFVVGIKANEQVGLDKLLFNFSPDLHCKQTLTSVLNFV